MQKSNLKTKQFDRCDFVKGTAIVAGAALLAACAPTSANPAAAQEASLTPHENQIKGTEMEGTNMNIVIIYDTLYGNTEKIAQAVKEGLGTKQTVGLVKARQASINDLAKADLVVVGSPTHGGGASETLKAFFKTIPAAGLQGKRAAAFDTGMTKENQGGFVKGVISLLGYASKRISKELTNKGASLAGAETFFVLDKEGPLKEGEIERARQWARGLIG